MKAFCPFCEKEYNNLEVQTKTETTTLNGVIGAWQKQYIACPDCGAELYNSELHNENLRTIRVTCKVQDFAKRVEDLCDYVLKLRMENATLRERLEKAIELPSGDRVWYIAKDEEGQESYIVPKPTSSLTVEELKYEMDKKYFLTREAAEARFREIKENTEPRTKLNNVVELPCGIGDTIYTVIKNCAYCKHYKMGWAECRAPATANFDCESTHRICFTQDIVTDECKKHLCVAELKFDLRFLNPKIGELEPQYFIDREAAEVRLKEIQGEER